MIMKRWVDKNATGRKAGGWNFWCPGCNDLHGVDDGWAFDGNEAAPTLSPSLLVKYGDHKGNARCHSFVEKGHFRYLSDCTHKLAGQTVPIPKWPESYS